MRDHLGEEYDGMISGVTEWGLYVELDENKCEGLVPMRDLADDYYDFDEKNYCLRGRRKGTVYRLGDQIRIRVANANLERKQLDFIVVDPRTANGGEHGAGRHMADDMGEVVTAAEALSSRGRRQSRHEKAKAAAKASRRASAKTANASKGAKNGPKSAGRTGTKRDRRPRR